MAGTRFTMDTSALHRAVNGALEAMSRRRTLLMAVGETLVSSTLERFEQGVGPDGEKWEASGRAWKDGLAKTARKKTKNRKGRQAEAETGNFGQTLVDTGRLKGSIVYETGLDHVVVGSNLEYAAIHQFGGKTGRGHSVTMPARPFVGINDEDKAELKEMMHVHLKNKMGG